jgi:transcription termination factor Rho
MNTNNKKILAVVLTIAMMILVISTSSVALTSITTAKATDTTVTRTLSTTTPTSGSTFDVTLNIIELQIGGIVETIPDGFGFVSTTHPSNQTYVSGQKVVFTVVNEASIRYEVRAPSEGCGTFGGTWYDALNEKEGNSGSTSVSVRVAETPMSSLTPTPSPPVPGFEAVFALAGLFVVAVLFLFRRKGGEGCE